MSVCSCYRDRENWLHERGVCYGTKECEPCSCGGDESKCNFYPEKRKLKPQTNADRIRAMTDEELADYLRWHNDLYSRNGMDWLDWLKQEAQ